MDDVVVDEVGAHGFRVRQEYDLIIANIKNKQDLISQKVLIKPSCKSQFPHRSVNLSIIVTNMKNKLSDLCGSRLLPNINREVRTEVEAYDGVDDVSSGVRWTTL